MSDLERRFHEHWLGLVQPAEGLVVSIPVLVDAQCAEKLSREAHEAFLEEVVEEGGALRITNLAHFFESVLELPPSRFDEGEALPKELSLYVPEGQQLLRPTRALRAAQAVGGPAEFGAAGAASPYLLLVWEVPHAIANLDKPEALTGAWEYPAQAKLERLLRECRVPLGLLSNGAELRLVYAPHGESSGWLAFRVADMASVAGRPIFDAFVMLLGKARWFAVAPERQLPALCAESRRRNVDVTNDLARQVFEALEVLLAGFAAAEERDGRSTLRNAIERGDEHLYAGLLTVLLRLVFLLYCEDRALLPVEHPIFAEGYSLLGLFEELRNDHGRFPDTMHRRFGAYPRLVALFRSVFQSRVHEPWARLLSSSMKTDLRYAASDCFETFPFPKPDPRTVLPAVEPAGEALYEARAAFMVETNQGLTKTYNALKDPHAVDPRVLELRRLHEAMDRAVLDAYGWSDLAVPPYCALSPEDKAKQKAFEDAVVDRLFALNAERAAEEAKAGGGAAAGAKGKGKGAQAKGGKSAGAEAEAGGDAGAGEKAPAKVGRKKKDPGPSLPGMG